MERKDRIDRIVDRFLTWPLPEGFAPDGGITFAKPQHPFLWPVGTNLFTAIQARQMLEHILAEEKEEGETANAATQGQVSPTVKSVPMPPGVRAWSDFPGHVLVKTGNTEHGMDLNIAIRLLRDLRAAVDNAAGYDPI